MLIGTKIIKEDELYKACKNAQTLIDFSDSLVPNILKHIPQVINNQRYIVATEVRSLPKLSFEKKQVLLDKLLEGVYIRGNINCLVDLEDLLSYSDMDRIIKILFKEELRK